MRIRYFISLLGIFIFCLSYGQEKNRVIEQTEGGCIPVMTVSGEDCAYTAGEHLRFTMHYDWGAINTDVGWATVDLDTLTFNGTKSFHVKVFGRTHNIYDLFFRVREDFQSWFSYDGLKPMMFTRDTQEGRYMADNLYVYDWEDPEPHIDADCYSTSSGQRNPQIPLTECTFDLPALFFFARNMDFDNVTPGVRYPMTFAIDDEVYNVYFILYGRETIDVEDFGRVRTIKFAAKLLAGEVFTGEEDMMIWVTDDQNRVPVLFEAPILVGTASGRLESFSGLKHPFSSLISFDRKYEKRNKARR